MVADKAVSTMRYIAAVLLNMEYGQEIPELPDEITYSDVFKVASMHSMASTVWYFIGDKVREECPGDLVMRWERETGMDFVKNLVQTEEFQAITKLLSQNKIRFLPIKGFLFKNIWKSPEYRTMADMDFYVDPSDMEKVSQLLLSNGYSENSKEEMHDTFDKPPYVHVEIHRGLERDTKESFDNWIAKEDDPYWYYMGDEDFVVYNVSHMYKHFVKGGCGARSLFDIHLYLKRKGDSLNQNLLKEKLEERGLWRFYTILLHLGEMWFKNGTISYAEYDSDLLKDGIPGEQLLEFEYFIATGGAYGNVNNKVLFGAKNKSKLGYVMSRLFLPYRDMREIYKWLKPLPFLLPIAYLVRIVSAVFNKKARAELRAVNKHYSSEK